MRRLKDLLTAVALIALCGVSISGAYRVWRCELPERSPNEMRELWDLLTNEDIREYDDRTLGRLAARLETELAQDTSLRDRLDELDVTQRNRLNSNIPALLRVWYFKHADAYGRLAGNEPARAAYVDEQFGNIFALLAASDLGGRGALGRADAALRFLGLVETWLAEEPAERVVHARDFNQAVLAQVMQGQYPGSRRP